MMGQKVPKKSKYGVPPGGAIFGWFGDIIKQIYANLESEDSVLPKHLKFIFICHTSIFYNVFGATPRTTLKIKFSLVKMTLT